MKKKMPIRLGRSAPKMGAPSPHVEARRAVVMPVLVALAVDLHAGRHGLGCIKIVGEVRLTGSSHMIADAKTTRRVKISINELYGAKFM